MKIPYAKPGTAMENKTGAWRTEKPSIDKKKCIKCGLCERYCPDGALEIFPDGADADYDYCKGCGVCANVCPVKCILMVAEEK